VTPFCARWQAEILSCARLQAVKKLDFLQLKASSFTNVSKALLELLNTIFDQVVRVIRKVLS